MNEKDIEEAKNNPKFLKHLKDKEKEGIKKENIKTMYNVLDSYIAMKYEKDDINNLFKEILKISFKKIEDILEKDKKLTLEDEQSLYIRSQYEFGMMEWGNKNFEKAKKKFFILFHSINDERLKESLCIHIILCSLKTSLEKFHNDYVNKNKKKSNKYKYFIITYKIDEEKFFNENQNILKEEFKNLQNMIEK